MLAAPENDASLSASRSMVLMGLKGDLEIQWDSTNDSEMRAFIQERMDEGVRFAIMKKVPIIGMISIKSRVRDMSEVANSVIVRDKDLAKLGITVDKIDVKDEKLAELLAAGTVRFAMRSKSVSEKRFAKTVDEVIQNHTVGFMPYQGG